MGGGGDCDRSRPAGREGRGRGSPRALRGRTCAVQGAQALRAERRAAAADALGQALTEGAAMSFDAEAYRSSSLQSWEEAAAGWVRSQDSMRTFTAPVSEWLIDALSLQPGQRVLELAAGLGETGMLAA